MNTHRAIQIAENCNLIKKACSVTKELYGYCRPVVAEDATLQSAVAKALGEGLTLAPQTVKHMREIISARSDLEC